MQYVTKTREDNGMIERTGVIYIEKETEFSWPIESNVVCDKNQIEQRHYRSYRFSLLQNQNWIVENYLTKYGLW